MTRGSHVRSHSSGALPVHSRSFLDCWNFSFLGSFRDKPNTTPSSSLFPLAILAYCFQLVWVQSSRLPLLSCVIDSCVGRPITSNNHSQSYVVILVKVLEVNCDHWLKGEVNHTCSNKVGLCEDCAIHINRCVIILPLS